MNKIFKTVMVAACMALLAGCQSGDYDATDPAEVARQAVEINLTFDVDKFAAVACEKMKVEIEASREEYKLMEEMMKGMGVNLKEIKYDLSQVTFEVVDQTEYTAKVHMSGPMKTTVPGMGEEVTEQNRDIDLIKEDGRWRLCSEIEF